MDNRVIPIFPLSLVQFPNAITPLHIFEPRYRQLLKDVMEGDKTFGILYRNDELMLESELLPPGSIGCSVEVAVVQELPDGRSNLLCVGISRFRLLAYVEGQPYQQAEVEFFEDEPTFDDLSADADRAKGLFMRLLRASRRLKGEQDEDAESAPDLPDDPQSVSFIVSAYLDIENSQKQDLLELTDTRERLNEVSELLARLADTSEKQALMHHLAKKNGHGGKLPKLD
jgi:Lon protease-like protein